MKNGQTSFGPDLVQILGWFDRHSMREDLGWSVYDRGLVEFWVDCSDVFAWALADAETITVDDLPALTQAYDDLLPLGEEFSATELWVARKRKVRPQEPWLAKYAKGEATRSLFTEDGWESWK